MCGAVFPDEQTDRQTGSRGPDTGRGRQIAEAERHREREGDRKSQGSREDKRETKTRSPCASLHCGRLLAQGPHPPHRPPLRLLARDQGVSPNSWITEHQGREEQGGGGIGEQQGGTLHPSSSSSLGLALGLDVTATPVPRENATPLPTPAPTPSALSAGWGVLVQSTESE